MKRTPSKILGASILALLITTAPAAAQSPSQSKIVDGIEIDWGVFPAQNVARSQAPAEREMHGGPIQGHPARNQYHLTVSLREAKTGKQIGDARVSANMHSLGVGGPWKEMQVMHIGSSVTYGNYFRMNEQNSVPYRIDLRIELPKRKPIEIEFTHYHD